MPPESRLHLILLTILAMMLGLLGVAIVVGLMLSWRRLQNRLKWRQAKANPPEADPWQLSAKRLIHQSGRAGGSVWDPPSDPRGKPRRQPGAAPPRRPGFDDDDTADPYEGLDVPFDGYDPGDAFEDDQPEDPEERFGEGVPDLDPFNDSDMDEDDPDDPGDPDDDTNEDPADHDDDDDLSSQDSYDDPFAPYFGTPRPLGDSDAPERDEDMDDPDDEGLFDDTDDSDASDDTDDTDDEDPFDDDDESDARSHWPGSDDDEDDHDQGDDDADQDETDGYRRPDP